MHQDGESWPGDLAFEKQRTKLVRGVCCALFAGPVVVQLELDIPRGKQSGAVHADVRLPREGVVDLVAEPVRLGV